MLQGLKRDRWTATLLLAGLVALLVLVLRDYGVGLPGFPKTSRQTEPTTIPISEAQLEKLFATNALPSLQTVSLTGPFFTTHFQPPKPPPPTTRKVSMVYQGFIQSTDGDRKAFIRIDDTDHAVGLGRIVIADLAVSAIQTQALILTNATAHTHVLQFNQATPVEVPAP
jgi:hypothetical protein